MAVFWGKYRGMVEATNDPTRRGRIKATVPAVLGRAVSNWAMPCAPYTGSRASTLKLPPQGTPVWIEFEGGDPAAPIWSGCFW